MKPSLLRNGRRTKTLFKSWSQFLLKKKKKKTIRGATTEDQYCSSSKQFSKRDKKEKGKDLGSCKSVVNER